MIRKTKSLRLKNEVYSFKKKQRAHEGEGKPDGGRCTFRRVL